ncbi:hypothetical protein EPO33_01840 [Patescibacteria group bacterium]|nr:MAG: hypothetical protein EPO33_01840 [Patescibacteria group bacterium]
MKVFIENERGSRTKNIFNEKTLEFRKSVEVSRAYPYAYGFVIGTTSGDGDNLDCFVLTAKPLKSGETIDVEPIGMFEMDDTGENDPKILATLPGESPIVDERVQTELRNFIAHVFDHLPGKKLVVGQFFGKDEAVALVQQSTDISGSPPPRE